MNIVRARHRRFYRDHYRRRADERGVPLATGEVRHLEKLLERCRRCFETPATFRVPVTNSRPFHGDRITVIYDTGLNCLVTVWPAKLPKHRRIAS